jgi:hypothetical protein
MYSSLYLKFTTELFGISNLYSNKSSSGVNHFSRHFSQLWKRSLNNLLSRTLSTKVQLHGMRYTWLYPFSIDGQASRVALVCWTQSLLLRRLVVAIEFVVSTWWTGAHGVDGGRSSSFEVEADQYCRSNTTMHGFSRLKPRLNDFNSASSSSDNQTPSMPISQLCGDLNRPLLFEIDHKNSSAGSLINNTESKSRSLSHLVLLLPSLAALAYPL